MSDLYEMEDIYDEAEPIPSRAAPSRPALAGKTTPAADQVTTGATHTREDTYLVPVSTAPRPAPTCTN